MSGSVNKVIIVGNLVADPDVKRTQDGRPIVNMRVATSESWKDRTTGERKERAEYHRVVIFSEGLAKVAEQYLKKGSKVYLEGSIQTREWEDQSGAKRYATEIVLQGFNATLTMLDGHGGGAGGRGEGGGPPRRGGERSAAGESGRGAAAPRGYDDTDDEIPF